VLRGLRLPIDAERLQLRAFTGADATPWRRIVTDPDYVRYIGQHIDSDAADRLLESAKALGSGDRWVLAITCRQTRSVLGLVLLQKAVELSTCEGALELVVAVLPEERCKGVASEAAAALVRAARDHPLVRHLVCRFDAGNRPVISLLRKLGVQVEVFPDAVSPAASGTWYELSPAGRGA
jgi:RimJ/RimL family protein N-acetyltransferase